ncbi:unnamed protein product, partial [Bubo scandiacus]
SRQHAKRLGRNAPVSQTMALQTQLHRLPSALIKTSAQPFIILVSFSIPVFPWLP